MYTQIDFGKGSAPWYELRAPSHVRMAQGHGEQPAPTIHFSAANGFPVGSYESFFAPILEHFNITAMDTRGAWRTRNKPARSFSIHDFADDLISAIEQQHTSPVIGMGHSHGGLITVVASLKRPDLFSKLLIIEPASLPNPWIDLIYRRIPKPFMHKLFPFIKGSHNRRRLWPTRQSFYDKYRKHATFSRFTDSGFADYLNHGLRETDDGQFELVYDPHWESHIFANVDFLWKFLRQSTLPTLLLRAEHSHLYSSEQFQRYNNNLSDNVTTVEVPNTYHLAPFEHPDETNAIILQWLKT